MRGGFFLLCHQIHTTKEPIIPNGREIIPTMERKYPLTRDCPLSLTAT